MVKYFSFEDIENKGLFKYGIIFIFVLIIYITADRTDIKRVSCEKQALTEIANSTDSIVFVEGGCWIMAWGRMKNAENSRINCEYLKKMNVLTSDKLYYQSIE